MIHRALKLLRSYHGLKQKVLAERLELSPSHLSEIEAGTKPVSYDLLEKYAKVFDIPVSSITIFAETASQKKGRKSTKNLQDNITQKALQLLEWLETISRFHDDPPPTTTKSKPRVS